MDGRIVSHFKILQRIGRGGMAEVYQAEDLNLGRTVALKFLPTARSQDSKARSQLTREAQAASRLDHPNICTIYEIGEADDGQLFIAMAYYAGETLTHRIRRGGLSLEESLEIAIQIAGGLDAAHRHDIVHCDVKPANVILTQDGGLKILDFGIARLTSTADPIQETAFGTLPYVAPERVAGREGDHRSDLWSLGVVLYRMLSGNLPFTGAGNDEIANAIRHRPAPAIDRHEPAMPLVRQILDQTLAKNPAERFNDARSMQRALDEALTLSQRDFATAPLPSDAGLRNPSEGMVMSFETPPDPFEGPAVALLPIRDLSPEQDQAYFCQGMAEELIHRLTSISGLRMVGRDTSLQRHTEPADPRELGRLLKVSFLLEGSVRKAGELLRVTMRLQQVADGSFLWSERYEREVTDVFAIQEDIARQVARTLELELVLPPDDRPDTGGESFEAHNLYLKGRYHWNKRDAQSLGRGIEFFRRAIGEEPRFARAHAGLADSWAMLGIYSERTANEVMPRAKQAAEKALELDPTLAEAHVSRALVRSHFDWDFARAERDFELAQRFDPSLATAHQQLAMTCLLPLGRFDEAFVELRRAHDLDPLSPPIATSLGLGFYYARHYRAAIEELSRVLEIDDGYVRLRVFLALAQAALDRWDEARANLEQAARLAPDAPAVLAALAWLRAKEGAEGPARDILARLQELGRKRHVPALEVARIHLGLGELELAIHGLEQATHQHSPELIWLAIHPLYDPLRREPGYHEILRQIGLPRRLPE